MGIVIEAENPINPGTYKSTIIKVEMKEGMFGPRPQVTFQLENGQQVTGFFAPKATINNVKKHKTEI